MQTYDDARFDPPAPVALVIVKSENGLVRPLDPAVKLPEHPRVIFVASRGS